MAGTGRGCDCAQGAKRCWWVTRGQVGQLQQEVPAGTESADGMSTWHHLPVRLTSNKSAAAVVAATICLQEAAV